MRLRYVTATAHCDPSREFIAMLANLEKDCDATLRKSDNPTLYRICLWDELQDFLVKNGFEEDVSAQIARLFFGISTEDIEEVLDMDLLEEARRPYDNRAYRVIGKYLATMRTITHKKCSGLAAGCISFEQNEDIDA